MRNLLRRFIGAVASLALLLTLVALPALGLDRDRELTSYGRQTWQTESGLPQNTIHAILQTHDGYIWLATEGGLVRFDGLKFLVYDSQNTPSLRSNNIRSLLEDREHALWIGTADGLTRFNGSEFSTFTTEQGLPDNSIWSVYQDRSGRLWIITAGGLSEYRGNRFKAYAAAERSSNSIGAIAEDNHGSLWIGTQDGLKLFTGDRFEDLPTRELPPNTNIGALLADRAGRIWIGTPSGLAVYQAGRMKTYTVKDGLPSNRIASIYEDKEGSIWVGTDAGLARITNGKIERLPLNDPLSASIVLSIYEDREGGLWLGTDSGGLTVLHDEKFTTYTTRDGLSDDLVRCVFPDRNGVIWAGTNGGLSRFENGRFSQITTKDGLSSNVILALAEDKSGNLVVGTPDGLNLLRNGRITTLTSADGLADDFVRSVYSDADGSLWIGTRRGLSHWKNGRFITYTQADGLGSDFVGAVLRDAHQDLWVGTLHGLTRLSNGAFRTYTIADGLSSNVITALYVDREGTLWIGTQDGGLNRFASGKIFRYPSSLGIPNIVYGLLEDANQNLWITAKTGIFRAGKRDLNAFAEGRAGSIALASYGTADGLRIGECSGGGHPAACKSRDGSLWFSTIKGLATLDPRHAELNRLPPPVVLESISIDDKIFDPRQARDIAPGHTRFSFEYAGLSFIAPHRVRFKYKLEGFDRDWIDAGTRRIAYYTNLPPRRYRFRVMARNNDGVWNPTEASFAFRLEPRFYQTYWFDALLLAAFGLLGYEIYRWRVKQVEAQFNAVLAERNRIAREIHDTLAQGFVAVSVQLEVVARMLSISSESAQELLARVRGLVRDSISEARRSIWELRSQDAGNEDLASRLSKMAAQVTSTTPVKMQFQVLGTYRALPRKIENELLRIGQEAVTNVVRHAEAKHVRIALNFDVKKLRMTIADDGRGFTGEANSSGPDGHFGLKGMRERAEQIDAELTVNSNPGEGTSISVETVIN